MISFPNVLLLTVDALRADRTSLLGYSRPTTPNLERLAGDAIVCRKSFTLGTFTQTACVQILTSSRPLSHGGYDFGARGRPKTIFDGFHDAGYHTTCLSTLHWVNRFFGYGDGVDDEYQLFGLITLPGVALAMTRGSLGAFERGEISTATMLESVGPVLTAFFHNAGEYCELFLGHGAELARDFPDSPLVNAGYDFGKIGRLLDVHQRDYVNDPVAYIRRHLLPVPVSSEWMRRWLPREWYYCRRPWKLAAEGMARGINKAISLFDPALARKRENRFKIYPDAAALAGKVVSLMAERDPSRPFFIWTHFMDTHAPYVSGGGQRWYRETPDHLAALGYPRDLDPGLTFAGKPKDKRQESALSALYDASIRFTDQEIGRVLQGLDNLGLRDDTLVVISGDHGEELGEHGDFGHFFQFYDESSRVPTLYHRPGIGARSIYGFSTIMDIAPTTAALAGISRADGWEGADLSNPCRTPTDRVLMESFYAGNCLFDHRPLYFAVRTDDFLYIWREYLDPADKVNQKPRELFDLRADPGQHNDIYRPDHPVVAGFNAVIAARMAELHEIPEPRIAASFGNEWRRTAVMQGVQRASC